MSSSESEQQSSCSEGMSQKQKRGAPRKYKSDEIILWKVFNKKSVKNILKKCFQRVF